MILTIDVREPYDKGALTLTFVSQSDKEGIIDIDTAAFTMSDVKGCYIIADKDGLRLRKNS